MFSPSLHKKSKKPLKAPLSPPLSSSSHSTPISPPLSTFSSSSLTMHCGRCSLEIQGVGGGGTGENSEGWKRCGVCGDVFCGNCWKLPLNKNPCSLGGGGHVEIGEGGERRGVGGKGERTPTSSPPSSPIKVKSPRKKITNFSSSSSTASSSSCSSPPSSPLSPLLPSKTKSPPLKLKSLPKKKIVPLIECARCSLPISPCSPPPHSPPFPPLPNWNQSVSKNRKDPIRGAQKCLVCGEWFCVPCQQLSIFKNSCSFGGSHVYEENGEGEVGGKGGGEGRGAEGEIIERGGSFSPTLSAFSLSPSLFSFVSLGEKGGVGEEMVDCGRCAIEVSF